jgi:hypothetical protein
LKNIINEEQKSLVILTIPEVASKIELKDFDATKNWLTLKSIKMFKETKQLFVYELDVDVEIDLIYAKELKRKYPLHWQQIYKMIAKDNAVFEMVKLRLEALTSSKPKTKISPKTKEDNEILKLLQNA